MKQITLVGLLSIFAATCGQEAFGGAVTSETFARQSEQRKAERDAALPKMQAVLKEIAGVELGQAESSSLPEKEQGKWYSLKKPYRYFSKMNPSYEFGRLVEVYLYFETAGKYSSKSIGEEIEASKKDICEKFGIKEENVPDGTRTSLTMSDSLRQSVCFNGWAINIYYSSYSQSIALAIRDLTLVDELRKADRAARESKLEKLPVFASGNAAADKTAGK